MTHTVIGLFDNATEAQAAMQELIQNGFARESIDVSNRSASSSTTTTTNQTSSTTADSGNSVNNFFNSLFGQDSTEARTYSNVASDTEGIVTVQTDSEEKARVAAEILDRNGAVDVDERGSQYQQNFAQTSGGTTQNQTTNQADMTIPVIEEDLQVGKRTVEQGGVRVRSRIIEKPVEETIRLREEHVVVNRHPVNRAVTDSDFSTFKEGEMEITERAEQAVVSKQARVVEEVSIGKQVEEREQVVSDTVRRTDVEVEEVDTDINTRTATNR